jgi:phage terminase large subunit
MLDDRGSLVLKTPRVFLPLLQPARYKGARGGRGSGKSYFFADSLIERAIQQRTRAACIREIQLSLKNSSKLLLEDRIRQLGVQRYFDFYDERIDTEHGGLFIFTGMQNHTADSIKSLEGFDVGWVEEAQKLSAYSLELLRPTFRNPGSELWFSWNPISIKDPVEQLLVVDKPHNAIVVTANYNHNPFITQELLDEMELDKRRDPDKYAHVWLGKYRQATRGRVFRNIRVAEFETPANARFYFGGDWGFSVDPTVLIRCFIVGRTLYIDYEAWEVGCEIDHCPALFAGSDIRNPPRWVNPKGYPGIPGATRWPIRADSSNPQSISYMRRHGFDNISPSVKGPGSVEEGVEFLKSYDIVIHPRCTHVVDEFSTYSYKIDKRTEEVLPVLEDKKNHTIDACRYAVELVRRAPATPIFSTYGSGR